MWECKPFKHLGPETRKKRLQYIEYLMKKKSVAGVCEIRDKGEKRTGLAGSNDGEVGVKFVKTENCAPGGGYLDWDEPLHQDSDLEESYRKLFMA